ncbi:MAG: DUF5615 family PIN-like protein [Patescibacteria group bacterium]|nr:DUF5615 family PIN-like protein [Patescibacteria group bacterium]
MFKFLADECVNTDILNDLRENRIDVVTVFQAGLTGAEDEAVFKYAIAKKRILLSFDRGFGDIFRFNIAKSPGVMIVLIGQMSKTEAVKSILTFLGVIKTAAYFQGKLAILGKTRIRIINR